MYSEGLGRYGFVMMQYWARVSNVRPADKSGPAADIYANIEMTLRNYTKQTSKNEQDSPKTYLKILSIPTKRKKRDSH